MIKILTLTLLSAFSPAMFADQSYYDIRFPGHKDKNYLECDNYVRNNHNVFTADMKQLIQANNSQNWELTGKLIKKYDNEDVFINNPFAQAVYDCGLGYIFSDGKNHYRNLYADISWIIISLQSSTEKKQRCPADTDDILVKIQKTLNIIINSTNKAANKSLNQTGAKDAPPG